MDKVYQLIRKKKLTTRTMGELLIEGKHFGYILEDKCRDFNNDGDLNDEGEAKVYGQTAIPAGKYELALTYSNNFKKFLPLVMGVKGFSGIRIHGGNTEANSLGCPLLGANTDWLTSVWNCRTVNQKFINKLASDLKKGKVFLEVIFKES